MVNILESNIENVIQLFRDENFLKSNETITEREKAGQGNMNLTLRFTLSSNRSIIVKQAFEYCYRFPSIPAPLERLQVEAAYYREVLEDQILRTYTPELIGTIDKHNIIVLEDLGKIKDMSTLYQGEKIGSEDLKSLCDYLSQLHTRPSNNITFLFNNEMRSLNHEYIFDLPLKKDNNINLDEVTPGLQRLGDELKSDQVFVSTVNKLGREYLECEGPSLLHGDYYPASWLRTSSGVKIIDSEFAFYGPPEFDIGVFLAHMVFSDQSSETMLTLKKHMPSETNWPLACQFAGVEMMRRILSVSMIRPEAPLDWKKEVLLTAQKLVVNPDFIHLM